MLTVSTLRNAATVRSTRNPRATRTGESDAATARRPGPPLHLPLFCYVLLVRVRALRGGSSLSTWIPGPDGTPWQGPQVPSHRASDDDASICVEFSVWHQHGTPSSPFLYEPLSLLFAARYENVCDRSERMPVGRYTRHSALPQSVVRRSRQHLGVQRTFGVRIVEHIESLAPCLMVARGTHDSPEGQRRYRIGIRVVGCPHPREYKALGAKAREKPYPVELG